MGNELVDKPEEGSEVSRIHQVKLVDKIEIMLEAEFKRAFTVATNEKIFVVAPYMGIHTIHPSKNTMDLLLIIWRKGNIYVEIRGLRNTFVDRKQLFIFQLRNKPVQQILNINLCRKASRTTIPLLIDPQEFKTEIIRNQENKDFSPADINGQDSDVHSSCTTPYSIQISL